ncbi:3'-5' exonuclease [Bifidobacterium choloepi]|uniref:3'-5' exonuclease n=1 Tax=Bifidobacterium choloepi TaxID=2614131 RepID=A0A6I5NB62_9BIFI|nr:3'-5' exonuclease [Bifidobacterium choloepi]NEG69710.1 3'-5' exonuclease [Bifidobacterium choloepi]
MKKRTLWYVLALIFALTALWGFGSIGESVSYFVWWFVCWGVLALIFFTIGARTNPDARFGKQTNAAELPDNYTAIDLVTTGDDPNLASILEFGAVRVRDGQQVDKVSLLVNPGAAVMDDIPDDLAASTGLDEKTLADQPAVDVALHKFLDFVGDDTLVAPNVGKEQTFLEINAQRAGVRLPMNSTVDPLAIDHEIFPSDSAHTEEDLLRRAGAGKQPAARALANAEQTVKCYEWLSDYVAEHGIQLKEPVDLVGD